VFSTGVSLGWFSTGSPLLGLSRTASLKQATLPAAAPHRAGAALALMATKQKHWLSVRKEDSMGARRSSVMIKDGTTEEKESQHDD
jgi:hypothetical protein